MTACQLAFDRGTLTFLGAPEPAPQHALWDPRSRTYRAPAYRYGSLATEGLDDTVAPALGIRLEGLRHPELRSYQLDALRSLFALGGRGIAVLPTGAGKTRLAIALIAQERSRSLVLCPTRALLEQWVRELEAQLGIRVGVVGDGEHRVSDVTVMTFASARRHLDKLGGFFRVLVADEVHHLGAGRESEALEMCVAPIRLGLTATAPRASSAAALRLEELIGPVVYEICVGELTGTYLAPLEMVRLGVRLSAEEAAQYEREHRPFAESRAAFFRAYPHVDYTAFVKALASSRRGFRILAGYRRAQALATFPRAKRALLGSLLERHAGDKTLVFTAGTEAAQEIAREHLVHLVTADIGRAERTEVLRRFSVGVVRTLVSARVLNEGIDVPDAGVAIVMGGALGPREHIQRIGRVLRPAPGKRALVYELVTLGTLDDARSRARSHGTGGDVAC